MMRGVGHVRQLVALRMRARLTAVVSVLARIPWRREWEAYDPRDGRPLRRFWTETGGALWCERNGRGLDYGRRGAGWVHPYPDTAPGVRVSVTGDARPARRKLAGVAAVLMAFSGGWLAGAGSVSTADASSCPAGTVATYSLDRGDMSRCVSPETAAAESGAELIPVRVSGDAVRGYTVTRVVDGAGVDWDTYRPDACEPFRGARRARCEGAADAASRLLPELGRALRYGIRPCVSDDGSGIRPCVWRADRRGNGRGRSFVALRNGAMVYLSGARVGGAR